MAAVPAFERSQKGITECCNLIVHFRVSLLLLSLLEMLHPHSDLSLCLSLSFSAISFSQQSFLSFFSFPISHCPPLFAYHIYRVFNFTPLFSHRSDSVLLCLTLPWTGGRAAGPLHPCVRDGNHRGVVWCGHRVWHGKGRPHPAPSRMTWVHAPSVAVSKYWGKGIKDNHMYPGLTGW